MSSAAQWNQLGPSIVAGVIAALVAVYVARYTVSASVRQQERVAARQAEDDALRRVSEALYSVLTGMDEVAGHSVDVRPMAYLPLAKKVHMAVVIEAPVVRPPMQEFLVRVRRAVIRAVVAWELEASASRRSAARQQAWTRYRRLIDRLALGANWQIGQWRIAGEEPSLDMFDDIDRALTGHGLPDTGQRSTEALNAYFLQFRSPDVPDHAR